MAKFISLKTNLPGLIPKDQLSLSLKAPSTDEFFLP